MKRKLFIFSIFIILFVVFGALVKVNLVLNDNTASLESLNGSVDKSLLSSELGKGVSKLYSDKSQIKLYNKDDVYYIDLDNKLYKIDLRDIKAKLGLR
ncbi:hypothetical protein [Inconstantimicrobium mannanitabidum]|uniref:Uncharacterized protein n=1 Tax=Inconstantimicrobium mannanitabidum TaxID=1604901 RepID=A0ACB5R962_9CLOT|nr:hypothetical protein [Clostridium sp. TW13]GKX65563.1 hypothetical protein rsdtw13_08210 [Clostridium sp. TW13]